MWGKGSLSKHYIAGSGGHATVLVSNLTSQSIEVHGFFDASAEAFIDGLPIVGPDEHFSKICDEGDVIHVGVGAAIQVRAKIFDKIIAAGINVGSARHKFAIIDDNSTLGEGVQVMAGAVIQPRTTIHDNVVINTGALIDHDCLIGKNSFISPGVIMCGGVTIGENVFIGAGVKLLPGAEVAASSFVNAGQIIK